MADLIPLPAIVCTAPAVHDGDTLTCSGQKVRLWGMDAPEMAQSPRCRPTRASRAQVSWACDPAAMRWSVVARDRLIQASRGQVICRPVELDRYRRVVARCYAGVVELNRLLVRDGLARDYSTYSRGAFLADETRARRAGLGMWDAP